MCAHKQVHTQAGWLAGTHAASRIMSEALWHPWSIVRTIRPQRSTETTKQEDAQTHTCTNESSVHLSFSLSSMQAHTHTFTWNVHLKLLVHTHTHTHKSASNWHYCTIQSRANFLYFISFGMVCNSIVLLFSFDSRSFHVNPTRIIGSVFFIFRLSCDLCTFIWHLKIQTVHFTRKCNVFCSIFRSHKSEISMQ